MSSGDVPPSEEWAPSPYLRAANLTYLLPFIGSSGRGRIESSQVCVEMPGFIAAWASRLRELTAAGLPVGRAVATCWPRYLSGDRRTMWHCGQVVCPYCHGRVIARMLQQLCCKKHYGLYCTVISSARLTRYADIDQPNPAELKRLLVALRRVAQQTSSTRAEYMQAEARVLSLQVELDLNGRGVWLRSSELYVTGTAPTLALLPVHSGTLRASTQITRATRVRLAYLVARAFPYPVTQLTAPVPRVLAVLQALRNQKRFIADGFLKGVSK